MNSKTKFAKSNDRLITGVSGGIAEYFGWSKALTRVIMLMLMLVSHGLLLIPYIILAWLMPSKPIEPNQGFASMFSNYMGSMNGQSQNNKKRKEIKNVEEHDVNE